MSGFFEKLEAAILCSCIEEKCRMVKEITNLHPPTNMSISTEVARIETPGLPPHLELVAPRLLKRRGMGTQEGRNALMHAIAHIEFNAINLALDAAFRFRGQPQQYYLDWVSVAADEARHFQLIEEYLRANNCEYGDYPVHNGLWEMALKTDHDVLARMALVPRVLEARGLDVTPGMIQKLQNVSDVRAVKILQLIYEEEIGHVAIGSKWFHHHCDQRGLDSDPTFLELVDKYLHGELRGPYNKQARLQAGFGESEILGLEAG